MTVSSPPGSFRSHSTEPADVVPPPAGIFNTYDDELHPIQEVSEASTAAASHNCCTSLNGNGSSSVDSSHSGGLSHAVKAARQQQRVPSLAEDHEAGPVPLSYYQQLNFVAVCRRSSPFVAVVPRTH